ncbi:hypothetical protein [Microcoleus asticus]|uniref:Uncharacterized protein n=1 Tax=Microcoleus asticus IPMA8 TaxID=2563858 RepID=A0ABX2CZT6_9CYAN|nr:hypothetical protein [Microcoleus asticus]NQE35839.1 hypothetical protein [Microcoleus asticus IPMA8]
MRVNQFSSQQFSRILTAGLTAVATITAICATILPNAQAQVPSGRYQIQSNNQIFFYPANGTDPVVVYNGKAKAVAITQYGSAVYTAFEGGKIYRSPDGQGLGGSGKTTLVYSGSQTVRAMLSCQGALFVAYSGGYIYRSPDGQGLDGSLRTQNVYKGSVKVNKMTCDGDRVVTSFENGKVYLSPDGLNLGGGGKTTNLSGN